MVKKLGCMACIWLRAAVEIRKPSARFTTTNRLKPRKKAQKLPSKGTPNTSRAATRKTSVCT